MFGQGENGVITKRLLYVGSRKRGSSSVLDKRVIVRYWPKFRVQPYFYVLVNYTTTLNVAYGEVSGVFEEGIGLIVSRLHGWIINRSVFEYSGTENLCCVLVLDTLLSLCLSTPLYPQPCERVRASSESSLTKC